jgi:hypothetical protein
MSREERTLSYEIIARKEVDPYFRDRLQYHMINCRNKLKVCLKDITTTPEEIDELDYKVRLYGKLLAVAVKMDVETKTKEDAFAEANMTAQLEEAEKQSKLSPTEGD